MKFSFSHTRIACYCGFIVQALVINLPPILFIIYQNNYGITNEQLGRLVLLCFISQLITDVLTGIFAERIGLRRCLVGCNVFAAAGLLLLSILPAVIPNVPYWALLIPTVLYAIGAGAIEVLVSPVLEALPSGAKAASMSILHSFYCWGQMSVVLFSTLYFVAFGQDRWYILPVVWALIPAVNAFLYLKVPLVPIQKEGAAATVREIFSSPEMVLAFIVMLGAGASELSMSQWASMFAESALGVTKTVGDLAGPCLFALLMGLTRTVCCSLSEKIDFTRILFFSAVLCIICYIVAVFAPSPAVSLIGCASTGISVALMWPTTLSLAVDRFPRGGTRMFALLAIFGDMGCSIGPWLTGLVSDTAPRIPALRGMFPAMPVSELGLKAGLFTSVIFPILMIVSLVAMKKMKKEKTGGKI